MSEYICYYNHFTVKHTYDYDDTINRLVKLNRRIKKLSNLNSITPITNKINRLFDV